MEWMQFGESSFFVPVMLKMYTARLGEAGAPLAPRIDQQLGAHVDYANDALSESLHFVGDGWTGADVMMSFPAEIAVMQGMGERAPRLAQFVEAVHARPAWQRAREKSGPYFGW
jgi:glutathione S-transferase